VADERRAYVVRDAGAPSRLGKVYKLYPHTLASLLEALEDARFRSHTGPPQVVIRRYEHGKQVPDPLPPPGKS
jgi:hypothetical protein